MADRNRLQLVLDAGGVLIGNLSPGFWQGMIDREDAGIAELRAAFKQQIREDLWTGRVGEEAFWQWVSGMFPEIEFAAAKSRLTERLHVLPAFHRVQEWSAAADVHILSNHRHEWLAPALEPLRPYVASVTISSEAGCCKPGLPIYRLVQARLRRGERVLFVDDAERNLQPARDIGWETLLADRDGRWVGLVDERLRQ
ncbi:HAD family hydrolase [Paenibacillus silvisoli]|uniref:HAD family hydrolase n=1 Tax=Paenibacillus silvisoli TaxID=3110539 RepID=UPI002803DB30|nr:HAD-IA family hydrolase [Paenibacillus silvisoli]